MMEFEQEYKDEKKYFKNFNLLLNGRMFHFVKGKMLGRGGHGTVFLYYFNGRNDENHKFAVKLTSFAKIDKFSRANLMNGVLAESQILIRLNHENIVKSHFSYNYNDAGICFVMNFMEFCNSGTLWDYIQKKKNQNSFLEESEIIEISLDIVKPFSTFAIFIKEKETKGCLFIGM